jgi:drug/metabolite transporter (DMT)-like permease
MTRAYSVAQASVIAPFEYGSLPIGVMWGFLFWREIPAGTTIAGAVLTLLSGLYILVQEQKQKESPSQIIIDNPPLESEA